MTMENTIRVQHIYNFVEFAVNRYRSNTIYDLSEIKKSDYEDKPDCYISMFRYPEAFKNHTAITKSVSGYGGLISLDYIYVDFDCLENIEQAKQDLQNFIQYGLGIFLEFEDFEKLRISFSGAKGFTLAIPKSFIGYIEPCNNLNLKVKSFVKNLSELVRDETSIIIYTIDFQIYDKVRVIRLNNTINSKSGLYKIPLLHSELINFTLDEIKELAKQKRYIKYSNEIETNEQLSEIFNKEPEPEATKINCEDVTEDLFKPTSEGNRNNRAFEIASRLHYHNNPTSYIRSVLTLWNNTLPIPLADKEIESILNSVNKYEPKNKTVSNNPQRNDFLNFEDREREYKKYIAELSHKKVYTGFHTIDEKLRGIRPGNVVVLLAQTGIGKSALCQNVFYNFLKKNDELILFFSIEMDSIEVFERELQLELDVSGYDVEHTYTKNQNFESCVKLNEQNRFITVTESVDIKQIPNYVTACENLFNKKVALVCIDYLGLIHNNEFRKVEYDRVTNNIGMIRDYAKESKVPYFILSQIKREGIKERINLFSAKSSGDIEQASHIVLALEKIYKENLKLFDLGDTISEVTLDNMRERKEDLLCLTILKNRRGGKDEVLLKYNRKNLRMSEMIIDSQTKQSDLF